MFSRSAWTDGSRVRQMLLPTKHALTSDRHVVHRWSWPRAPTGSTDRPLRCNLWRSWRVLRRQVGQDRLVYLVFAEDRLILPEAKAPQPDHNVHDGAPHSGLLHIIVPSGGSVQEARNGR